MSESAGRPPRGHDVILDRFRQCAARDRMGSAYLFVGPEGVGKRTVARYLAQGLLCRHSPTPLRPCGTCPDCRQVAGDSHPDVAVVQRPPDRAFIPLELLVGDREHRSGAGFCHWVSLTPTSGRKKIGIIDDADYLNVEGANSLLKTLEEPPDRSVLILIATSEHRQLPTIRSRCQVIRFSPLPESDVADLLVELGHCPTRDEAMAIAQSSEGSLETALQACDADWLAAREQVWSCLAKLPESRWDLVECVTRALDGVGTEVATRRRRLKVILNWSIQFYRAVLRDGHGLHPTDVAMAEPLRQAVRRAGAIELAGVRLERALEALEQVDRNVMLAGFVDAWVDDLAEAVEVG